MHNKNLPIANISNVFAFNVSWKLTAREWNVVLYLSSKVDSKNDESFKEQSVLVKELERALKVSNSKWGGIYKELEQLREGLLSKPINFYTDVEIDGKPLRGGINFFEMIYPEKNKNGEVSIRFKFTDSVKPFLLQLRSHFVSISQTNTKLLKSGHSIRFFLYAKGKRDMMRNYEKVTRLRLSLDDLRGILAIEGKYSDLRNFKRVVINKIEKEINTTCESIEIAAIRYYPLNARKKEGIEFDIIDRKLKAISAPEKSDRKHQPKELASLTYAQDKAYHLFVDFGVKEGIAFKQILPKIKGSEIIGFEDWYAEKILSIFSQKTKVNQSDQKGRAAAFVKWFHNTTFKDDQFSELMEYIHGRKKQLEFNDSEAWHNRQMAKTMTNEEFKKKYRTLKREQNSIPKKDSETFTSIADLIKRQ